MIINVAALIGGSGIIVELDMPIIGGIVIVIGLIIGTKMMKNG